LQNLQITSGQLTQTLYDSDGWMKSNIYVSKMMVRSE
jgi:hypothetical protein